MKPLRLQTRLALASAGVIAVGLLVCCLATVLIARHEAIEEIDLQLQTEASQFFAEWKRHGGAERFDLTGRTDSIREWLPVRHPQRLAEISRHGGEAVFRSKAMVAEAFAGQAPGVRTIRVQGRRWRYLGVTRDGITLRMAANLHPVSELTGTLLTAFLIAAPVLVTLAILSGRLVARRSLEPIRRIAGVAERITAEQLEERVPVPPAQDEIRQLATVLNETFERLKASFELAQRFSADASHELKTPLTVLRTSIEHLLESPTLVPEDQAAVASLLEQTRRLASITQSLLLLARADAGRLKLEIVPADLWEILQACAEDAVILGEPGGVKIEADLPRELQGAVDRGRLSQIIVNLLDNAVKYNVRGGRVRMEARATPEQIFVKVGNTGPAIPAEHAPQIFERFFRADANGERAGHGLGLSLSRELARAHGGELILLGSADGWTEFELSLPRR